LPSAGSGLPSARDPALGKAISKKKGKQIICRVLAQRALGKTILCRVPGKGAHGKELFLNHF